jgi:hypothetical protein
MSSTSSSAYFEYCPRCSKPFVTIKDKRKHGKDPVDNCTCCQCNGDCGKGHAPYKPADGDGASCGKRNGANRGKCPACKSKLTALSRVEDARKALSDVHARQLEDANAENNRLLALIATEQSSASPPVQQTSALMHDIAHVVPSSASRNHQPLPGVNFYLHYNAVYDAT